MKVPAEIRRAMEAHAEFCYPEESCGLLAADDDGRLLMAYCLTNADRSPVTYSLDPEEHFHAMRSAEARGWHLAGVFHSHPASRAYPSPTDVERALEPDWLYVLVGRADSGRPEVRAFWIRDGEIREEQLSEAEAGK